MTRRSQAVLTGSRALVIDPHAQADRALALEPDGSRSGKLDDDDFAEEAHAEHADVDDARADQAQADQADTDEAHADQTPTDAPMGTASSDGDGARLAVGGSAPDEPRGPDESLPDAPPPTRLVAPRTPPRGSTEQAPPAPASELGTTGAGARALTSTEAPRTAASSPAMTAPILDGTTRWGILCRVAGPGSVAGSGFLPDGRPGHFWVAGERGYFSQASIDKLPHLLIPVRT
jgi:hypothetical protein